MGHILSQIPSFLASVFTHWQIWLSGGGIGGFIVIAVNLGEKLSGKALSKKASVYLFLIAFFLCSCFLSWVEKNDAVQKLASENTSLVQTGLANKIGLQQQISIIKEQCAYKQGLNDALQTQNRDQQSTINKCQSQALSLLTPAALKITPLRLSEDLPSPQPRNRTSEFLLLTNKPITPVSMTVVCDQVFEIGMFGGSIIEGMPEAGGSGMIAPNAAKISITSPAWTPVSPMVIRISYVGTKDVSCNFNER